MDQTKRSVGFLYDPAVLDHRPPKGHPERPERVAHAITALQQSETWDYLTQIPIVPATIAQIERVHSPGYLNQAQRIIARGGGLLDAGDTVASAGSWNAATTAAGGAIGAVDAVMTGKTTSSFALVRPPGHHALPTGAMGFCILNNVAIAAAHALAEYDLQRVMIVDFDVHHGNGTQEAFYSEPRVLFFSTHQYPAYPGTGALMEIGEEHGTGYTVNVPMPPEITDSGYEQIFEQILRPLADDYKPELVLVSAGYDAHWRNSAYVGGIDEHMTVTGYYALSQCLYEISQKHCPGKLAGILEGGYDLDSLAGGIEATLRAWLGLPMLPDPVGPPPNAQDDTQIIQSLIERVRQIHSL